MRNYELIKAIYDRCLIDTDYTRLGEDIIDMIERERPEFRKSDFWKGGYIKNETNL